MPNLSAISHAVIYFNTVEGNKQTGIGAMMKLCFGNDDDAISQIMYRTEKGNPTPTWVLPTRHTGDTSIPELPIYTGKVGEELLSVIARAADRLKKAGVTGKLAGRSFRVTTKGVEEIKDQAAAK